MSEAISEAVCGVEGGDAVCAVEIAAPRMEASRDAPCAPGEAPAVGAADAPARSWSISAARKPALPSAAGAAPPAAAAMLLAGLAEL